MAFVQQSVVGTRHWPYRSHQQCADPSAMRQMAAEDRAPWRVGYDVYRFGSHRLAALLRTGEFLDLFASLLEVSRRTRTPTVEASGQVDRTGSSNPSAAPGFILKSAPCGQSWPHLGDHCASRCHQAGVARMVKPQG